MKRKIIVSLIFLVILFACLTSCEKKCNHEIEIEPAKFPTCTEKGCNEWSYCKICGEVITEKVEIEALGHDEVHYNKEDATCLSDGHTEGVKCTACGEVLEGYETIKALGHDVIEDKGHDATCNNKGLTDGTHCNRCGEIFVSQKEIDYKHRVVTDPAIDATCKKPGYTEGSHCELCGVVMKKQELIVIPHEYEGGKCINCDSPEPTNNLRFERDTYNGNDVMVVTYVIDKEVADMVIPSVYEGLPVVKIHNSVFMNCKMQSIFIPSTIKVIDDNAFAFCSNLKKITIQGELDRLGNNAFRDCSAIEDLTFSTIKTIGVDTFVQSGAYNIDIYYNGTIDSWAESDFGYFLLGNANTARLFIEGKELTDAVFTTCTKISKYAFCNIKSIDTLVLNDEIESIGTNAFDGTKLSSITLKHVPEEVDWSDIDQTTIIQVHYNGTIDDFIESEFKKISCWFETYGYELIINGEKIKDITVSNGILEISDSQFAYLLVDSITLPDSITKIGSYAFSGCKNIKNIVIPDKVEEISTCAFSDCVNLREITIGKSVNQIGYRAFDNCTSLLILNVYENTPELIRPEYPPYHLNGKIVNYLADASTWDDNKRDYYEYCVIHFSDYVH